MKIRVLRHGWEGHDPTEDEAIQADALSQGKPFLLTIGDPSRKKGSDLLLKAWSRAMAGERRLIWVTRSNSPELCRPGIIRAPDLSDGVLAALHQKATATIIPSRWEGYSFPLAESLARGVPSIASAIPAHVEFGEGPFFFEKESVEELSHGIDSAFLELITPVRKAFPSWESVARELLEIYLEVSS